MIDWLFWAWVIVTVLLFVDLFIPDPIPFIDEVILIILFFGLLTGLFVRMLYRGVTTIFSTATHPIVLAFVVTFMILFIYGKMTGKFKKKKYSKRRR